MRDRPALGRAAVGDARRPTRCRRDRSRPRVRHRRAPDDAALPRAAARRCRAASLLDVGCGSGVLAIAAAQLGFAPGHRGRHRRGRGRGDAGERRRERRRGRGRAARRGRRAAPAADDRLANIALAAVEALAPRLAARARSSSSGYLARDDGRALAGFRRTRAPRARRLGGMRRLTACGARDDAPSSIPRVTRFTVDFLGCKVSHVDAHEIRERLLADGHIEARPATRRRRGDQHVLRHERGGREEPQGRRPGRAHAPPRLRDRLRREPRRRTRFAGLPANVIVVARRAEETPGVRRRRRRRDRLRPGRRAARPRARVREDPGRLLVLVRLLRDPARPRRRRAAAAPRPCSREVRRRVAQGHREVVLTGINLGCFRDRAAGYDLPRLVREAAATPGLARLRLCSIEINHVERRARRGAARDADGRAAPARAAPVGRRRRAARDGPPLLDAHATSRELEPLAGEFNLTTRRDRRLPDRGRARVREHAAHRRGAPGSRRCTSSRTRRARARATAHADPVPPAVKKERERAAARALARARAAPLADEARHATTSCSSTGPAAATATTTRRCSSTRRSASSSASARRQPSPRRGSLPSPHDDCLFCDIVREGTHVAQDERLRRDPRHQPEGADAPARHPGAPRRHVPRDLASSAPRRRSGCSSSSPRRRASAGLEDYRVQVNVGPERGPDGLPPALARARRHRRAIVEMPARVTAVTEL